jgi:addiction module HigA family antidote
MSMYNPAHPGEILKELIMEPMNISIKEVAQHLNISRNTLSKIINGKGSITPEMAIRLELLFEKPSAEHWLRLQNSYDLWQAKQHITDFKVVPLRTKTVQLKNMVQDAD